MYRQLGDHRVVVDGNGHSFFVTVIYPDSLTGWPFIFGQRADRR
jgi:hypothetical protein